MSTIGSVCEALRRASGTYLGAISRPVDAGDGEVEEVVWTCSDRHDNPTAARLCAERELADQRRWEREVLREQEAAGYTEGYDDPDSLNYRG